MNTIGKKFNQEDIGMNLPLEERTISVKVANTMFRRAVGLLFSKKLTQGALILYPCKSIHMFFMRFPIDVVFLNKEKVIVQCIEHLKPWKVSPIVKESYYVLELPVGSINNFHFRKGIKIRIPKDGKEFKLHMDN